MAAEALMAGASIVNGLINLWSAQKALKEGRKESRRAERTQIELFEKQTAEERKSEGKRMRFESETEVTKTIRASWTAWWVR